MKLRAITCLSVFTLALLMTGCADKPTRINPTSEIENANKFQEDLAYKRGYEKARKELREVYIKEGFDIATKIFQEYARDIKAFEAGKYALKDNLVTYPKIVALNTGSGIRMKSLGCEIRDTLTPEEIMSFYAKRESLIPKENDSKNSSYRTGGNDNRDRDRGGTLSDVSPSSSSFADSQTDPIYKAKRSVDASNEDTKKVYQKFTKTYTFQDQITKFDLNCQDRDSYYLCMFPSQKSLSDFCTQSGACQ